MLEKAEVSVELLASTLVTPVEPKRFMVPAAVNVATTFSTPVIAAARYVLVPLMATCNVSVPSPPVIVSAEPKVMFELDSEPSKMSSAEVPVRLFALVVSGRIQIFATC